MRYACCSWWACPDGFHAPDPEVHVSELDRRPETTPAPPTTVPSAAPSEETDAWPAADEEHPRGTLFLMALFLILVAGLWTYVYLLMLERG